MRINGSNSVQNIEVTNQNETAQPKPASSQVETSMVAPKSANDTRAASKSSESGFGASMIANQLRNSSSQNLGGILSNLSSMMQSSSSKSGQTLLERAKSVIDPDDIQGAKGSSGSGASATPHLVNNGGKVLSSPAIANIYVGSYFNTAQGQKDVSYNDAAAKAWTTSGNEAILKQYGVGKGSFAGSTVVNETDPKKFTDAMAQKLVKAQIAAGNSPAGDSTIHTIVLPPGTILSATGATSTNGLGGYHGSYTDPNTGKQVYYAVIVNSKGSNGIDFTGGNNEQNVTITESHEWAEAATDPDVALANKDASKLGWYDNNYGEIGDIAIDISKDPNLADVWAKDGSYDFQDLWSNSANKEENVEPGSKA